jgi:Na+/pantothenate symporter
MASAMALAMVFANSHTLVVLEIALLSVLVLSLALLIRRWKTQEAIRSALASIVFAAGAIISYKVQHSEVLILVPGVASALFAIFAFREFRSQKASSRESHS